MSNHVFGYARVSTNDQNVDQQAALLMDHYDIDVQHLVTEVFTGTTLDRPKFESLISRLREGDTLVVYHVSRLGRKASDVLHLVEDLQSRGVSLKIHELGGMDIASPQGKMVFTVLAGMAEMEREYMMERQRIGIERAKKEGKYHGRKATDPEVLKTAKILIDQGMSKRNTAKQLGIGESTLYRLLSAQ